MIFYISKVALCSSLLYLVYYFLLEREKMHTFKRFYLLFAIIFSFSIPFASISVKEETKSIPMITQNIFQTEETITQTQEKYATIAESEIVSYDTVQIVFIMVLSISVILLIRFVFNLWEIIKQSQNTIKHENDQKINIVLVDNLKTPYSFWNTIFLDKLNYEQKTIKNEILIHELTHVKQKHTADVLFIELLLSLFWFNPIFYLYRRAIKLNHEFLVDESVVINLDQVSDYQLILINQASNNYVTLASNFNYLITKKRLMMMTKTTLRRVATAKKMILIPFIFLLICLFSNKVVAHSEITEGTITFVEKVQETKIPEIILQDQPLKFSKPTMRFTPPTYFYIGSTKDGVSADLVEKYNEIINKYDDGIKVGKAVEKDISDFDRKELENIFRQMSRQQQEACRIIFIYPQNVMSQNTISQQEIDAWVKDENSKIWIDDKLVKKAILKQYSPDDFALSSVRTMPDSKVLINIITKQFYNKKYTAPTASTPIHMIFTIVKRGDL